MATSANTPRRPNIFIASSKEALEVARAVKQNFDDEADVDIWNENIFHANRNYLDTLLNRASFYDYVIAVFTPDDEAIIREKHTRVTRDNIIFEFGLFLGRLGPNRTFLILQEDVELFSDWSGIEVAKFRPRENLVAAVGNACSSIRQEMKVAEKLEHFSMLPSTSLAIGYYNNFLRRVFEAFEVTDRLKIIERYSKGNVISETGHDIVNRYPTIEVQIPQNLQELDPDTFKQRTFSLKQIVVSTKIRSFPFYIEGDAAGGSDFKLFDIPTTMYASYLSIQKIFTTEFLARDNNYKMIESREIANFERTLRIMVPDKIEKNYFKFSVLD
jgi:hypothetical protein